MRNARVDRCSLGKCYIIFWFQAWDRSRVRAGSRCHLLDGLCAFGVTVIGAAYITLGFLKGAATVRPWTVGNAITLALMGEGKIPKRPRLILSILPTGSRRPYPRTLSAVAGYCFPVVVSATGRSWCLEDFSKIKTHKLFPKYIENVYSNVIKYNTLLAY